MNPLNHNEVIVLLIQLSVLLIFARIFGELSRLAKQPAVIGEILGGIVIGPSLLGGYFPDAFNYLFVNFQNSYYALDGIGHIGVILLLFVAGMELDLALIVQKGKATGIVSMFGLFIPFLVGVSTGWFFYNSIVDFNPEYKLVFSLFFGTVLAISALPVIAKTLLDLNLLKSQVGTIILSSAMVDDLISWIFFSVILSMMATSHASFDLLTVILGILFFIIFMLTLGRSIINRLIPHIQKYISGHTGLIAFSLVLCLLGALFTQYIGIHSIFGAFIIGIAVGNSEHFSTESRDTIHQFTSSFFAPLFFVMIGLKINFIANFDLGLVIFVLFFAFISKIVGVWIGAYFFAKIPKNESWAIAFGLNARGEIVIILGLLGYEANLINQDMFVAIVIMAIITSITSGPFLNYFVKNLRTKSFIDILNKKAVYFTNAKSKTEMLKELSNKVAADYKLNEKEIYLEILKREEIMSTGLQNHLAIPHAKFNLSSPIIIMAVSKEGIEFDSLDGLPAKVIILLITPRGENDLQLSLLAEIAKKFRNVESINSIVESISSDLIISQLKKM